MYQGKRSSSLPTNPPPRSPHHLHHNLHLPLVPRRIHHHKPRRHKPRPAEPPSRPLLLPRQRVSLAPAPLHQHAHIRRVQRQMQTPVDGVAVADLAVAGEALAGVFGGCGSAILRGRSRRRRGGEDPRAVLLEAGCPRVVSPRVGGDQGVDFLRQTRVDGSWAAVGELALGCDAGDDGAGAGSGGEGSEGRVVSWCVCFGVGRQGWVEVARLGTEGGWDRGWREGVPERDEPQDADPEIARWGGGRAAGAEGEEGVVVFADGVEEEEEGWREEEEEGEGEEMGGFGGGCGWCVGVDWGVGWGGVGCVLAEVCFSICCM